MRMASFLNVIDRRGNVLAKVKFYGLPPIGTDLTIKDVNYKVTSYKLSLTGPNDAGAYVEEAYQIIVMKTGGLH